MPGHLCAWFLGQKLPIRSAAGHNSTLGSAALQRTEAGLSHGEVDSSSGCQ